MAARNVRRGEAQRGRATAYTVRDVEMKRSLTKVRAASIRQLASVFYANQKEPEKNLRRRVGKLGWKTRDVAAKHIDANEPLFDGLGEPDFSRLSYLASRRYQESPVVSTTIVQLPQARTIRTTEVTHDLLLAQVFLRFFYPDVGNRFLHEDEAFTPGETRADAVVIDETGNAEYVIDVLGGRYAARKIASIWLHWQQVGVRCVLW